jgi:transcriptional/translational regulatory protein YebC/TACO1
VEKVLPFVKDKLEEDLINLPIKDFSEEEGKIIVETSKVDFIQVKKSLEEQGYHIIEADLQFIADNTVKLSPEDQQRFSTLLEALENDEDVDMVRHNVE